MAGTDVVVVGGGIAGSALAARLARGGCRVLVLERQERFRDRVRGEAMAPWGVLEARRLDLEQLLLDCGGGYATMSVGYDELVAPSDAEAQAVPMHLFAADVPGMLDVGHPQACEALAAHAVERGATYLRSVGEVEVAAGATPWVRYEHAGAVHEVSPRLVVGADGRESAVRKQLGIGLTTTTPRSILTGMLVSGLDEWPTEQMTVGTEGDVHFLVFPRPGGIARLYVGHDIAQKDRFTGPERTQRFLDAFKVDSLPLGGAIAASTPAGPCAGHPGTNSWTDRTVVTGAVLVGDAAGWSDQLIGQGLSIAMRDARSVAEVLLGGDDWAPERFADYVSERTERMRRIRIVSEVMTDVRCDFTPRGRARRAGFFSGLLSDPRSATMMASMLTGPEVGEDSIYGSETIEHIRTMA
jgi:2-polyprenyl-6-methoxyphenol hydroxylase-like FAD-dependent oxidoreductase